MARSIQKAKAKAKKATAKKATIKTIAFGVYYKGDTVNGMGMTLSALVGIPQDTIQRVHDLAIDESKYMVGQVIKGRANESDSEIIAQLNEQLALAVAAFNVEVHGTPTQPLNVPPSVELTDTLLRNTVAIAAYVGALIFMGAMKDDNQNGWHVIQEMS